MRRYWTAPLRPKTYSRRTSSAVSSARHFPGAQTRRRLKPADAVTVLYSAIFATAAVLDAGNKERHRLERDREIRELKSALEPIAHQPSASVVSSNYPLVNGQSSRASNRPRMIVYSQRRTYATQATAHGGLLLATSEAGAQLSLPRPVIADEGRGESRTLHIAARVRRATASRVINRLLDALLKTISEDGVFRVPLQNAERMEELRHEAAILTQTDNTPGGQPHGSVESLEPTIDSILTSQNETRKATGSVDLEDCVYKICETLAQHPKLADSNVYFKLLTWFANRGLREPGLAIIDACLPQQYFRSHFRHIFSNWPGFERFACLAMQFCLRSNSGRRDHQLKKTCELMESFEVKALWTEYRRHQGCTAWTRGVRQYSGKLCASMVQAFARLGQWTNVLQKLSEMQEANLRLTCPLFGWIIYCCSEKLALSSSIEAEDLEIYKTAAIVWPYYQSALWQGHQGKSSMWKTTSTFQAMLHLCSLSGNDRLAADIADLGSRAGMRLEYIETVSKARMSRHAEAAHAILANDELLNLKTPPSAAPAPAEDTPRPQEQEAAPTANAVTISVDNTHLTPALTNEMTLSSDVEPAVFQRIQGTSNYAVL